MLDRRLADSSLDLAQAAENLQDQVEAEPVLPHLCTVLPAKGRRRRRGAALYTYVESDV